MSSLGTLTTLAAQEKSVVHEEHLYQIYQMVSEMIQEQVPLLIEKELKAKYLDLLVKIQTQLNGKDVDFPEVRDYIMNLIFEELRNGLK